MQSVRVGVMQFQHENANKSANLAKMEEFVEQAARQSVRLLVFPECCITGYWFLRNLSRASLASLAEAIPSGVSVQHVAAWARQHNMTIGAGLAESDADGHLYNSFFVAMPDGRIINHRKLQAFEGPHMSSGNDFTVFDAPEIGRLATLICYDNNIPENARICALRGAEIMLAPHQTGGCASLSPHAMKPVDWKFWNERHENPQALAAEFRGEKGRAWLLRWLPARAHDNGLFYLFANGIGPDDDEVRTGNAMILDPYGRIIAESNSLGDDLVIADLDPALRDECTGLRWIRARRPELYGEIAVPTGKEMDTRAVRFRLPAAADHETESQISAPRTSEAT